MGMNAIVPQAADLIVFDGTCIFCSGFARFMARRDVAGRFRFVTAHSALGRALYLQHGLDPDLMETNIVITGSKAHVKMAAFAAAVGTLAWPWRMFVVLGWVPKRLADPAYDWIARNRYRFGRQTCLLPTGELKARLIE
jgi:predicted DCC family thiol-disulfide oxidoreductase YuxK